MNMFSLRTLIDDILLIVRNNNISESEDLSRDQIASWILQYKAYFAKKENEKDEQDGDDDEPDETLSSTIGPIQLIYDPEAKLCACDPASKCHNIIKRTKDVIHTIEGSPDDIISVHDISGCVIQYMHKMRRHYHNFRRYTYAEPTCWFDNGYIYIQGDGIDNIDYIYVDCIPDPLQYADDEDQVNIPGWMIPDIKLAIMRNELGFMLKMPSDDSNNSTLASVKPNGPQDKEK